MSGRTDKLPKVLLGPSLAIQTERQFTQYLDKLKCWPWGQDDVLIGELIFHVLFQTLFIVDFPVVYHIEKCPGRDSNGDSMLGFGLWRRSRKRVNAYRKG